MRFLPLLLLPTLACAVPPEPKFRAVTLDPKIQIGYGVAVADVDGDKNPDVLLADKKQFVWYRNPGAEKAGDPAAWTKHLLAENLTAKDNVCLAAQDIDGDGKCEIAVGGEWNPSDTLTSGAVFYLIPPADRTQPWTPVKFPSVEPTTHRMRWIRLKGNHGERGEHGEGGKAKSSSPSVPSAPSVVPSDWGLVVVPLHGRGNKNGEGAPVKVLLYHPPTPLNDPQGEWKSEVIDESMHMTHNFDVIGDRSLMIAGKEGLRSPRVLTPDGKKSWTVEPVPPMPAGEVRHGSVPQLPNAFYGAFATIEPMHGNTLALSYSTSSWKRIVLTDRLVEGHALAFARLQGWDVPPQIVVGWRGSPGKEGSTTGVAIWTPMDQNAEQWRETVIDPDGMACEDLVLADLDGDGRLDIVASGRATRNVKIYFNETPRP